MSNFICPRCHGTDIYFAQRQEIKSFGSGQRARMVKKPLCRACGELANVQTTRAPIWVYILIFVGVNATLFGCAVIFGD